MNSPEGHGHAPSELRLVESTRERFKAMMEVVSKSFKSLANALLSVLSAGTLNTWEEPQPRGQH